MQLAAAEGNVCDGVIGIVGSSNIRSCTNGDGSGMVEGRCVMGKGQRLVGREGRRWRRRCGARRAG